jgi:hypothetical protein
MPWSDVQVLQDRLRESDDALQRAQADFRSTRMKLGANHEELASMRDKFSVVRRVVDR